MTKEEYDKAVIDARKHERAEVLGLEGSYNVAKQEAYYRLITEKHVESSDFEALVFHPVLKSSGQILAVGKLPSNL